MQNYDKATYGADWAADYDQLFPDVAEGMIDRLEELAAGGRVLELAIGTGRVALPLAERGVSLTGIDISSEMVARLREKPGGETISVAMGDFADVDVEGKFSLVYVVANTIFVLLEDGEQVRCFANAAKHLEPEGRFVIEAFVPDLGRFDRNQRVEVSQINLDSVVIEASRHDLASQLVNTQVMEFTNRGVKLRPVSVRYSWPSEHDLMAQLAGMTLEQRWGGWLKEPYTNDSLRHVSVYKVPAA